LFQDFQWGAVENKPGFKLVARLSSHGSLDLFLDKFRQDFYESIHSFLSKDWLLEGNGGSKSIPLSASGLSSTSPSIRSCWPRSSLAMSCLSMSTPSAGRCCSRRWIVRGPLMPASEQWTK